MNTVTVSTSRTYSVLIGTNLIHSAGSHILKIHAPCKAAIISDSNVWPIYGEAVCNSLEKAGFSVIHYTFAAGESSKNAQTYIDIVNTLAQDQLTRSDLLIALGGGVVGDITGFAAATYLRGISFVQIPTSLLAMVDSSVGGKTAIDLPAGKNLVGAFYQPNLVLCDIDALSTLPERIFRDGCAEVIKYGILYDSKLFSHLRSHGLDFDREYVISRCVELKRDVVVNDEFDTGERQKLNLGHTIGHAVEAQSCFSVSHGEAVAIGMAIVARASAAGGLCDNETALAICDILNTFKLPVSTQFTSQQLYTSALSDKKRSGGSVNLIIPRSIGACTIEPTPVSELRSFIEAGL